MRGVTATSTPGMSASLPGMSDVGSSVTERLPLHANQYRAGSHTPTPLVNVPAIAVQQAADALRTRSPETRRSLGRSLGIVDQPAQAQLAAQYAMPVMNMEQHAANYGGSASRTPSRRPERPMPSAGSAAPSSSEVDEAGGTVQNMKDEILHYLRSEFSEQISETLKSLQAGQSTNTLPQGASLNIPQNIQIPASTEERVTPASPMVGRSPLLSSRGPSVEVPGAGQHHVRRLPSRDGARQGQYPQVVAATATTSVA